MGSGFWNTYADRLANDAMDAAAQSAAADADPAKIVATESPTSPGWTGARGTHPTTFVAPRADGAVRQRLYSGRGSPGLNGWGGARLVRRPGIWRGAAGSAVVSSRAAGLRPR